MYRCIVCTVYIWYLWYVWHVCVFWHVRMHACMHAFFLLKFMMHGRCGPRSRSCASGDARCLSQKYSTVNGVSSCCSWLSNSSVVALGDVTSWLLLMLVDGLAASWLGFMAFAAWVWSGPCSWRSRSVWKWSLLGGLRGPLLFVRWSCSTL